MTEDFSQAFPLEPAPGQQAHTPAPRRRSLLARPAVTGLLGFLAGAVLVGVPWLVLTLFGGPSGRSLSAPPRLGELSRSPEAIAKFDARQGQAMITGIEKADRETAARVSAAYDGAGALAQHYQDDRLRRGVQLIAVRAPSPGLVAIYDDFAALGQGAPGTELVRIGDVQCLRHNGPAAPGSAPAPQESFVTNCQRTGPDLTVTLRSLSSEGNRDPRELAALVDQAWRELS
ncbi:hypothetical protein [Amycolatopsis sp. DG1A-15b]|uniref:hypothetical protein n=1 Tax=Amycolatopsis sp. DG1A-15b TaxID=3052846 RepID=UPI00255B7635|nr:hypothetical protein [Amycolatopsis sp. DG1A-15b]WIX91962.1 hypothetical protein QRY02_16565 [Amycolatopsis sp. DG1A-15b]